MEYIMIISIICLFLPVVGLVCLCLALFLFNSKFFKEVLRYGTEEAISAARFNRKLLKKTCLFACILPVISLVAVVVPLLWKAPVQIILAEGSKQELATVTVEGYDVPSGVYTFDIEDLNTEAENAVVYYENGFYIEYYKTETCGKVDLMYSGDGEVFITCGIVLQPDDQTEILYLFPTDSYEEFQNDKRYEASENDGVYTVYYREKVDVDITIGAIYILLAIDAASAAVGAIVYNVKRKKYDFSF